MKPHINSLLAVFFCCFSHSLLAQLSLDGYLITAEGDSIRGTWIEYFEVEKEIRVVIKTPSGESFEGDISTISEYGKKGAYLRKRFKVQLDSTTQKSVFLKCLVLGDPSLYVYPEAAVEDIFYLQKFGGELLELPPPFEGYEYKDGQKIKSMNYSYRQILGTQFTRCVSMYEKAMELEYREERMIDIITDYHRCAKIRYHKLHAENRSAPQISIQGFGAILPNSFADESLGAFGGGFTVSREYFNQQSAQIGFEFNYHQFFYPSENYDHFARLTVNLVGKKRYYTNKGFVAIHGGMGLLGGGLDVLRDVRPGGFGNFFVGFGIGRDVFEKSKVELFARAQYLGSHRGVLLTSGLGFQIN